MTVRQRRHFWMAGPPLYANELPIGQSRSTTLEPTHQSLLARAQGGDAPSWERLVGLYGPLIREWLIRHAVSADDADDLTQDVLLTVMQKLPEFEHGGRVGSFRCWL